MLPFSGAGPDWRGNTVWIIGGGPSVKALSWLDIARLTGITLGVNKSAWFFGCDAMVTLDQWFVHRCRQRVAEYAADKDAYLAAWQRCGYAPIDGATYLGRDLKLGLSRNPGVLHGDNSGFAALNLAYLKGATDIRLLGFDMRYDQEGNTHGHGGYPWHSHTASRLMPKWAHDVDAVAPQLEADGVRVINYVGEPVSRLTAFETRPLGELHAA